MKLFFHWLLTALAILVAAYLLHSWVSVTILGAVVLAVVLGLINVFVKPAVRILTLPINILTLGIFSLVLNALLILLAAHFVEGFTVHGFWAAFFFSILVSLINAFFHLFDKKD